MACLTDTGLDMAFYQWHGQILFNIEKENWLFVCHGIKLNASIVVWILNVHDSEPYVTIF